MAGWERGREKECYCAIAKLASEDTSLAGDELNHLADGHARGESVWVHDNVWGDSLLAEGKVLLPDDDAAHSLLSVATTEFVTHLGNPRAPHQDLDHHVVLCVRCEQHLVHATFTRSFVDQRRRLESARRQKTITLN